MFGIVARGSSNSCRETGEGTCALPSGTWKRVTLNKVLKDVWEFVRWMQRWMRRWRESGEARVALGQK